MTTKQATCAESVQSHLESRLETLQEIWDQTIAGFIPCETCAGDGGSRDADPYAGCEECDGHGYVEGEPLEYTADGDNLSEFGLSFDYVEPGTFNGQAEGYWRYQLGWGGPSDEFRFYLSPGGSTPYRIEYWFMDWFDGASVDVTSNELIQNIWHQFANAFGTTTTTTFPADSRKVKGAGRDRVSARYPLPLLKGIK